MSIRSIITVCLAALLAACAAGRPPAAPAEHPLRVVAFPGGSNWPVWVAMDKGYFAAEKLTVTVTPTPDSTFQMRGLIQGDFDVAITSMDNVIAYREGQGRAGVIAPDLVAVMGVDPGWLSVVADPRFRSYAGLRGKVLSVDALTTGYAFVLLEILERLPTHARAWLTLPFGRTPLHEPRSAAVNCTTAPLAVPSGYARLASDTAQKLLLPGGS